MLNKELSHLSESSKSGNQISEYICSTFLGELHAGRCRTTGGQSTLHKAKRWKSFRFVYQSLDKQQEVDVQTFDNQPSGLGALSHSSNPQKARSPRTMSQISGFKRPLMHTNSFTSDRLPVYGVETPHEATLGAMLNDINTWGIDIFKIGTLSCNRPLTCVAYQIFQVGEKWKFNFITLTLDNIEEVFEMSREKIDFIYVFSRSVCCSMARHTQTDKLFL